MLGRDVVKKTEHTFYVQHSFNVNLAVLEMMKPTGCYAYTSELSH
jgi:hypothetical protein